MKKEFAALMDGLKAIHADFKLISTEIIVVADWVRWKCQYGCRAYGKHLSCPPYTPSVEETRRLIQCYERALVARFEAIPNYDVPPIRIHHYLWDAIRIMHDTMFELERYAFLSGYYKAFAMVALPCTYCEDCLPEREGFELDQVAKRFCEHQDKVRPAMEACGVDVITTVRDAGYELEVLTSLDEKIAFFGLLLID
jgi:predicted metal-binding protein